MPLRLVGKALFKVWWALWAQSTHIGEEPCLSL